ncbi:MAG: NACHT domain-containing protein, partial [Candidatus Dormibacteraeota bacterium]|nr:NACHT domain-containing protein [Candidatus Dormibacteraeota bacterium]
MGLVVCTLVSATATVTEHLHLQMGLLLTVFLALLAVLSPVFEGWLKQAQSFIYDQDQREQDRIKALAERARLDVLEQVRRSWVRPELQGSLYRDARLQLNLVARPEAVENPLRELPHLTDEREHFMSGDTGVGDVYRELGKQLLVLGEPGAGKTTLLMELTEHLLNEAEQTLTVSMPVVFHLSAWVAEDRSLTTWLVNELYKRYGVPRRLGRLWIETDQVIPLLDGLDEVAHRQRDSCAAAINAFHDDHGVQPLVVCSRLAEYNGLAAKLRLRAAIEIQPLRQAEVSRYLRQGGRQLSGLRTALRDDEQLAELLTTPLFLSIVAATYRNRSRTAVRGSGSLEDRRRHVLADFTDAMLSRATSGTAKPYSDRQTVSWLTWLAGTMHAHSESVFYFDWIQPTWLPRPAQRRLVTVGIPAGTGTTAAVLVGLFPWFVFAQGFPHPIALLIALVFAVPAGVIVG